MQPISRTFPAVFRLSALFVAPGMGRLALAQAGIASGSMGPLQGLRVSVSAQRSAPRPTDPWPRGARLPGPAVRQPPVRPAQADKAAPAPAGQPLANFMHLYLRLHSDEPRPSVSKAPLPSAISAPAAAPAGQPPANFMHLPLRLHSGEPRPCLKKVQPPALAAQSPSVANLARPSSASLAERPKVLDALQAHALAAGTQISRQAIKGYVALGESAVRALEQWGADAANAAVQTPRIYVKGVELTPKLEVVRAISWYVAACAALQDANASQSASGAIRSIGGRIITDLSIAGSYKFKDPNYVIYRFLNSSPLAYSRISTHFNEDTAGPLNVFGKAEQRGIEDYDRRLPGENGTLLFDKLKDRSGQQVMFFKFEQCGVPTLSSALQSDDQGQGTGGFNMILRNFSHASSFLWSRFASPPGVERKEHVYKGLLKDKLHGPFMKVVRKAEELGLLDDGMTAQLHKNQTVNQGLPHLDDTLKRLRSCSEAQPKPSAAVQELGDLVKKLQYDIRFCKDELGAQSNHLGITRRGAETHVDLHPELEPGARSGGPGRHGIAAAASSQPVIRSALESEPSMKDDDGFDAVLVDA